MNTRPTNRRKHVITALALLGVGAGALLAVALEQIEVPPRLLAPYLEHRLSGHGDLMSDAGRRLAQTLTALDRGEPRSPQPLALALGLGAQPEAAMRVASSGRDVVVASPAEALAAIRTAQPGDAITFRPGIYRFDGEGIPVGRPGTADAAITVRAQRPGTVTLELDLVEGFLVSAPHWRFENLTLRGVCAQHSRCEHAFHVVGKATHFAARNNTVVDFNAHFKINGEGGRMPDHGVIEGNTINNTSARETDAPVTPIDLVAASHWIIRGNLISDFIKAQGNRISYGAFAKGGGVDNRFERNAVLCEVRLRGAPGWRVGLSLGGGGSEAAHCRDGRCIIEQDGGVIHSNLIASCSDDGIYVNRAATSSIVHNTLIDTGGISVRFAHSSAEVEGNLVDGVIRSRDGAVLHATDNLQTAASRLYLGTHPWRALYRDAGAFDFAWSGDPPRRRSAGTASIDLCGVPRPPHPAYGSFEDFTPCLRAADPK